MHHTPICLTFAYYNPSPATSTSSTVTTTSRNKNVSQTSQTPIIILDPTTLEQSLSEGTISLALTRQSEICVIQKAGGIPLSVGEVMNVTRIGVEVVKAVDKWLESEVGDDLGKRVVEVR